MVADLQWEKSTYMDTTTPFWLRSVPQDLHGNRRCNTVHCATGGSPLCDALLGRLPAHWDFEHARMCRGPGSGARGIQAARVANCSKQAGRSHVFPEFPRHPDEHGSDGDQTTIGKSSPSPCRQSNPPRKNSSAYDVRHPCTVTVLITLNFFTHV